MNGLAHKSAATDGWTLIEDAALVSVLALCPFLYSFQQSSFLIPKETYAAIAVATALLARCVVGRTVSFRRPSLFGWALVGYTIVAAVSVIWSVSWYWTVRSVLGTVLITAFYLLAEERCQDRRFVSRGFATIAVSGVVVAILSILQLAGPARVMFPSFPGNPQVMYSTFGNDSLVAGYLALAAPVLVGYVCTSDRRAIVASAVCGLITVVYALLALQTRTAWIAVVVAAITVMAVLAIEQRKQMFRRAGLLFISMACVATLFAGIQSLTPRASTSSSTFVERVGSSFDMSQQGLADRIKMAMAAVMMIRDRPVLGSGAGTFGYLAPRYQGKVYASRAEQPRFVPSQSYPFHTHNDFLEPVAELGTVGLGCVAILVVTALKRVFGIRRKNSQNMFSDCVRIAATGTVAASIVFAAGHFPFHSITHATTSLFAIAALGKRRHSENQRRTNEIRTVGNVSRWLCIAAATVALATVSSVSVWRMAADRLFWTGYLIEMERPGETDIAFNRMAAATYLNPFDGEFSAAFGWALANRGMWTESIPFLERALSSWDMASVYNNLGIVNERTGNLAAAKRYYESARFRDPSLTDHAERASD